MSGHVFVSYAHVDAEAVTPIVHALRAERLSLWLDAWHLQPDQPWSLPLTEALRRARALLLFIGPRGIGRVQHSEWQQAKRQLSGPGAVIPVFLPEAPFLVYDFRQEDQPVVLTGAIDDAARVASSIRNALSRRD